MEQQILQDTNNRAKRIIAFTVNSKKSYIDLKGDWYKVIPYYNNNPKNNEVMEIGIKNLPLDTMTVPYTVLYLKGNRTLELYVRTRSSPEILEEIGYVIPKFPNIPLKKVYSKSAYLANKDHYFFENLTIKEMAHILRAMPTFSAIAVTVAPLLDYKGIKVDDVYIVQISVICKDKKDLNDLTKLISAKANLILKWKGTRIFNLNGGLTPERAFSIASELKFKLMCRLPTTRLENLRNIAIIPQDIVIPKGIIPTEVISRKNGFKVGTGYYDRYEFKISQEDFRRNCAIFGGCYEDLLGNIIKNLEGKIIVIDTNDLNIEGTVYSCDRIGINPLELPNINKEKGIEILADTLYKLLGLNFWDIKELLSLIYEKIDNLTPHTLINLFEDLQVIEGNNSCQKIQDLLQRHKLELDSILPRTINSTIPIEKTFDEKVTVFRIDKNASDWTNNVYSILIRYLTEIQAIKIKNQLDKRIYIVIVDPIGSFISSQLVNSLCRNDLNVRFIFAGCSCDVNNKKVGLIFDVHDEYAYVWINGEGPAVIKIDRMKTDEIKSSEAITNKIREITVENSSDYRIAFFGEVFKYIDPKDIQRAITLYKICKDKRISMNKREIGEMEEILQSLLRKGFIKIIDEKLEYNNGFEKWFSSAVPSVKGLKIVRLMVEYYFTNGFCVIPAKQKPGIPRPDGIAFPLIGKKIKCDEPIAIEIEAHVNKGEKTREQLLKNVLKNRDFKEIHVWIYGEDLPALNKIYSELDEETKEKTILKVCRNNSIESVRLNGLAVDITKNKIEEKRERIEKQRRQSKRKSVKGIQSLSYFSSSRKVSENPEERPKRSMDESVSKESIEKRENKSDDVSKKIETNRKKVGEAKEEDKANDGSQGIEVFYKGKIYELEDSELSRRVKHLVERIEEGTRKDLEVKVSGNSLKIIDKTGVKIAETRIKRLLK